MHSSGIFATFTDAFEDDPTMSQKTWTFYDCEDVPVLDAVVNENGSMELWPLDDGARTNTTPEFFFKADQAEKFLRFATQAVQRAEVHQQQQSAGAGKPEPQPASIKTEILLPPGSKPAQAQLLPPGSKLDPQWVNR